jgi:hypothetical protein
VIITLTPCWLAEREIFPRSPGPFNYTESVSIERSVTAQKILTANHPVLRKVQGRHTGYVVYRGGKAAQVDFSSVPATLGLRVVCSNSCAAFVRMHASLLFECMQVFCSNSCTFFVRTHARLLFEYMHAFCSNACTSFVRMRARLLFERMHDFCSNV